MAKQMNNIVSTDSRKVLFLTTPYLRTINTKGLFPDLAREIVELGHDLTIVSPIEKRNNLAAGIRYDDRVRYIDVRTGNMSKTKSKIIKGLSTITFEYEYYHAVKKFIGDEQFDLIIYSTPPISYTKTLKHFKKNPRTKTYLMLKDIFPQNAVDLEMMREGSLIHKYFRRKEKELYKYSDIIGCMSPKNVEYLKDHNAEILSNHIVELFPNAIDLNYSDNPDSYSKELTRDQYGLPIDKYILIYGGNIGKPQGPEFVKAFIDRIEKEKDLFFLIVGSGTEIRDIKQYSNNMQNIKVMDSVAQDEFKKLVMCSDFGCIFLDNRFTIPNFPQRLLSYMECAKPIIAATDVNTDIREVIENERIGCWAESKESEIDNLVNKICTIIANDELVVMGKRALVFCQENYNIKLTVFRLFNSF